MSSWRMHRCNLTKHFEIQIQRKKSKSSCQIGNVPIENGLCQFHMMKTRFDQIIDRRLIKSIKFISQ